ncbi:hypothetical protein BDN71DRAFT_1457373 [Pleurotus eryngii]|uniref:Uncharacterized protein n=1 Tax=Pleurotus eryngii TaxID=5323 RepID=A0A9P5ZHK7_PLEER|nr:hypothetical protein BDN71DRAFT_1457373 [Pleurotus eryngii]
MAEEGGETKKQLAEGWGLEGRRAAQRLLKGKPPHRLQKAHRLAAFMGKTVGEWPARWRRFAPRAM